MFRELLDLLFRNPEPETTLRCCEALRWGAEYRHTDNSAKNDFVFDYAKERYEAQRLALASLETKLSELLRFDGAIAAGLFAIVRIAGVRPSFWLLVAFGLLTLAMCLGVLSRQAFSRPMPASIREVMDGMPFTEHPKTWVACSLHATVEAMADSASSAAIRLNAASFLTAAAMVFLFFALLAIAS